MAAVAPRTPESDRSLAALFADLWRETSTLFREEAELAKAEIAEKMSQVETAVVSLAAGALILYAGFLVLLAALTIGLAFMLPTEHALWIAPLIIGVTVMAAGGFLLWKGRKDMKARNLAPGRTLESLRRDAEMAKEHAR